MSLIELEDISKTYGNKVVLNHFSLKIQAGEFVAITGESGCGKSTLLNIIGILEDYDSGRLIIDGDSNIKPNSRLSSNILCEKISYLFQNFALVDDETVTYNLLLALKYTKVSNKEKLDRIRSALNYVGLFDYEKQKIFRLSGGEQQRVAIARIMLKPSKIVLADEPTGSLDEKNRDIVLSLLKSLNESGKTIIIVTHDKYVSNYCQRQISLT